MRMAGKRLPICRNEHKQMRRNCYQQGRMEDHSIQRRVRQGTAVSKKVRKALFDGRLPISPLHSQQDALETSKVLAITLSSYRGTVILTSDMDCYRCLK